jgi:hypothetical protein
LHQKWSRGQVEARFANMPPRLIGMEACVGAHHLSRKLKAFGHDARLMPAKYVGPYSKRQKNDFRDAEAIAEAVQRRTMKFVTTKTADQLDLQALHRVRERLVSQRTGIINQIRPSCWSAASQCGRGDASCEQNCRALSPRRPTCSHPASCASSKVCLMIGVRACQPRSSVRSADERPWYRADYLRRHGRRDQHGRRVFQGARLCRLAGARAQADLNWRSHHSRQHIEAWQSLSARPIRVGSLGHTCDKTAYQFVEIFLLCTAGPLFAPHFQT